MKNILIDVLALGILAHNHKFQSSAMVMYDTGKEFSGMRRYPSTNSYDKEHVQKRCKIHPGRDFGASRTHELLLLIYLFHYNDPEVLYCKLLSALYLHINLEDLFIKSHLYQSQCGWPFPPCPFPP
jgi:hypothetical protein